MNFTEDTGSPLAPGGTVRYLIHDAMGRFVGYIGDKNGRWWMSYCPTPESPLLIRRGFKSRDNAEKALVKIVVDEIVSSTFKGV